MPDYITRSIWKDWDDGVVPVRRDGLAISEVATGHWVILPKDDGPVRSVCPCCNRGFRSQIEVMWAAMAMYPMGGSL